MYLQKLNPRYEALFQYPKRAVTQEDQVWYDNKPLGVNKRAGMMKEISKLASLSNIYSNHSVRATAITLWSDRKVPWRHIMAISGHRSEASLRNYNARPSSEQLRACSDILSGALSGRPQQSQQPSFLTLSRRAISLFPRIRLLFIHETQRSSLLSTSHKP